MIRLTLILLAGLVGSMLIWGTETPEMQAEAITEVVLEEPTEVVVTETDVVVEITGVEAAPVEPVVEVARLETVDFTSVEPTNALLVFDAADAPADAAIPVALPENAKILVVTGSSVNMRAGPSTSRDIVGNLRRGAQAELLAEAPDGWVQIRHVTSGRVGYMAARFLKAAN